MLTSSAALFLACAAFIAYDAFTFRRGILERASSLAQVIGNASTAALDFNDLKAAQEALDALRVEANVVAAGIYRTNGQAFASYPRGGTGLAMMPPVPPAGYEFKPDRLLLFRPISYQGEVIGTVFLASDLRQLPRRLARYAGIVALVFCASLLAALALSNRLQRVVSDPILHLAQVTRAVALEKNYSVRAVGSSRDELGQLIKGFNEMLTQIQERDDALRAAHDQLERRVEERTQELASSLSLLNATLDSTADSILAVDLAGRVICRNQKFAAMWGLPAELLEKGDEAELMRHAAARVRQPEQFWQRWEELKASPEIEALDLLELQDGRMLERYVQPQRMGLQCIGRVFNFRDITERKQAEEKVKSVHGELLRASRVAGMAEVATNVLHNVGNVLNSVNTSAGVISDRLRASAALSGLAQVTQMLEQHRDDLAAFLGRDHRGEHLIKYLHTLEQHLISDRATVLEELRELTRNIEHIKEIVARQQSYAKISGVTEIESIDRLLEDALRIQTDELAQQNVEVIRRFDPVPQIPLDKHKVYQILVNLIDNARHALVETASGGRRLTLRVGRNGGRVFAAVSDTGVGIAPENLTRIFSHGFTTRRDGHGFGLHSGAIAAREMGGSLRGESAGVGQGATFTLELPLPPNASTT